MSVQIGRVKGIPIRLHFTLLIVFSLVTWSLAANFMPQFFPGLSSAEYWTMGLAGAILLFISVLLHELSHSVLAMRFGIKVRQIMLFIFGGVSDIEEEPKNPQKEFQIAIAGPATSFVLAAIFAGFWAASAAVQSVPVFEGIMLYSAIINALLGAFNLLPAFPLDGRVLRAVLVKRTQRDFDRATETAVKVGIAISYVMMGLGFVTILTDNGFVSGIWLILIGWFLQSGAQSYRYQHELTATLSKVKMRDIMNVSFIAIPPETSLQESLQRYFSVYMKSAFPVTDAAGGLLGMITLKRVMDSSGDDESKRQVLTVREVMMPLEELSVVGPDTRGDEAVKKITSSGIGKIFVCDLEGRLLGMVTKTDLLNVVSERQEYSKTVTR
jgi:Zn-dependent protease/predicted transcriptional regulator